MDDDERIRLPAEGAIRLGIRKLRDDLDALEALLDGRDDPSGGGGRATPSRRKKPTCDTLEGKPSGDGDTPNDAEGGDPVRMYCDSFKARYGTYPTITRTAAGQLHALRRSIGAARLSHLIRTFFSMNDAWFLKQTHAVGVLVKSINAVTVAADTGKVTTTDGARDMERTDATLRAADRFLAKGSGE